MISMSNEAINEYQQIYKKNFGKTVSFEEARKQGERLIRLFQLITNPIERSWLKENAKSIQNT